MLDNILSIRKYKSNFINNIAWFIENGHCIQLLAGVLEGKL